MSGPTRDGAAKPNSRDQIVSRERGYVQIAFRIDNQQRLIPSFLTMNSIQAHIYTQGQLSVKWLMSRYIRYIKNS